MINKTLDKLRNDYELSLFKDDYGYNLEMRNKNHHKRYTVLVELVLCDEVDWEDEDENLIKALNTFTPKDIIEMYEDLMESEDYKNFNDELWEDEDGNWIDDKKVLMTFKNCVIEYEPSYGMDEIDNQIAWKEIIINEDEKELVAFAQGWIESMSDEFGDLIKIEFYKGDE